MKGYKTTSTASQVLWNCVQITAITLTLRIKTPHHMMATEGYGSLNFKPTKYIFLLALLCYGQRLTYILSTNILLP